MKVFFIGSKFMGCNYVRTLLPLWHNGWQGDFDSLWKDRKSPSVVKKEILESDIVVFHRPDSVKHHKVAMACLQAGKKIVFDNDDTFKGVDDENVFRRIAKDRYEDSWEKLNTLMDNFIRNSDMVTTTTEFLADEYRKLNKNVAVLPNYIDPMDWSEPKRNDGDKVRVGVVGSVAYYNDAGVIKDYLKELSDRKDVQLVMFGLSTSKKFKQTSKLLAKIHEEDNKFWESLDIEHVGGVPMHEYFNTLNNLRLDIMLIPRKDNYFNRCKSNIKYLEAAMCEIPVVAQSFSDGLSPYDADLDGSNGLLATDTDSWVKQTEKLIGDKLLRREIGRMAHEYVLKHYDIGNNYQKWADAYKKL